MFPDTIFGTIPAEYNPSEIVSLYWNTSRKGMTEITLLSCNGRRTGEKIFKAFNN
jgi:hypothetical protein